jgi:hypothetical protein
MIDMASDPNLGADGAYSSAYFQSDHIHPSSQAYYNDVAPIIQHAVNAYYGNNDWSSATTYTAGTTAAVTVSNATESGNTMTFTTATQAYTPGQCIQVTGVTPTGYNSTVANGAGMGCWFAISTTTSSFTAYNAASGLGSLSVAGTAIAPQELDADVYAILGGSSSAQSHLLQTCIGRTGHTIYRMITDTNAWTITPLNSGETIDGGATFTTPAASGTNHPVVALKSVLTSQAAGGCTWHASLQ